MEVTSIHSIYFFGIGGIGVSALARYFKARGVAIYGYDKTRTPLTIQLEAEGMHIVYDDNEDLLVNCDMYVRTVAVKPTEHRALDTLLAKGMEVLLRAQVLGFISRSQKCIAVSGTHGKTSTASLIAHLLTEAGLSPTAFVGGIMTNYNTNYLQGSSDIVIVEADEFNKSFLELSPDIVVLNSMDPDHLDIYTEGHDQMIDTYNEFLSLTKKGGEIFHKQGLPVKKVADVQTQSFGFGEGNCFAMNTRVEKGIFIFDYVNDSILIKDIACAFPGYHNVLNAVAAISVALTLEIDPLDIKKALANFKGIERRFEWKVREDDFVFVDDYAHHPAEIDAAISAIKALYPDKKITGVFQPHLFSRTKDFMSGFAQSLSSLDTVYLLPIYPAREKPIPGITSEGIAELMKHNDLHCVSKELLLDSLVSQKPEVLITIGAGDIGLEVPKIKELLTAKNEIL